MLIFDGHLDLAMNAVHYNRDLTRPLAEVREREAHLTDRPDRGRGVVCLPEMRRGGIGLCIATQIGHCVAGKENPIVGWSSAEIAWAQTQGQLAWYRALEERGWLAPITDAASLGAHVERWRSGREDSPPVGYILSLEGADSLLTLGHLERAYGYGLRAVGPAHYGPGRYAPGTAGSGGLNRSGRELLGEMRRLGMVLDVTHLTDEAFWEALDIFDGPLWASHNNCRALVPHQRQLSDEQIRAIIERDSVIGAALDAWMLHPGWERGRTTPEEAGVLLERLVDHIDHVCQLAGSARHCAIGSDLDGGFGREQCPLDLHSIADLRRLPDLLVARGFSREDMECVMCGNWLRYLNKAWGEAD